MVGEPREQVDLEGKRVFLLAGFNVSLAGDAILDASLRAEIPTLRYSQEKDASIVLASRVAALTEGRPAGSEVGCR